MRVGLSCGDSQYYSLETFGYLSKKMDLSEGFRHFGGIFSLLVLIIEVTLQSDKTRSIMLIGREL